MALSPSSFTSLMLALVSVYSMAPHPDPSSSWWLRNLPEGGPKPLTKLPASADVLVIGAGMTGCAVAHWLRRLYDRECLVIDARGVAGGATGRNGGHLWARPESEFETWTTAELLAFSNGMPS